MDIKSSTHIPAIHAPIVNKDTRKILSKPTPWEALQHTWGGNQVNVTSGDL